MIAGLPVVGYVRVSTDDQRKSGLGIDAQLREVREYVKTNGLSLLEIITDEGVSASTPIWKRPGGKRVQKLVAAGKISGIVAFKLDRLFRSAVDCAQVVRWLTARKVAMHLVSHGGGPIDTSSAMGKFFLQIMSDVAELERNMAISRTLDAMESLRLRGAKTGGKVPYGFSMRTVKGDDGRETRLLVKNSAEQEVIAAAIELRATGMSLRAIGAELTRRGMHPRQGGEWTACYVSRLVTDPDERRRIEREIREIRKTMEQE